MTLLDKMNDLGFPDLMAAYKQLAETQAKNAKTKSLSLEARLRAAAHNGHPGPPLRKHQRQALLIEAAQEIERLRAATGAAAMKEQA